MGKKVIPSIITAFKANGYDHTKEGASYSFLIVFAGNVFEIGDDLSMSQSSDGLYGIGSGSAYALGVMAAQLPLLSDLDMAKEGILEALAISAKYDINTCAPFQIEVQRV